MTILLSPSIQPTIASSKADDHSTAILLCLNQAKMGLGFAIANMGLGVMVRSIDSVGNYESFGRTHSELVANLVFLSWNWFGLILILVGTASIVIVIARNFSGGQVKRIYALFPKLAPSRHFLAMIGFWYLSLFGLIACSFYLYAERVISFEICQAMNAVGAFSTSVLALVFVAVRINQAMAHVGHNKAANS
jgi:hypothetical protein